MAGQLVTIVGVIADLYGRVITGPVQIMGQMTPGAGPGTPPPDKPPVQPPGIWPGPGDPDYPAPWPPGQRPPGGGGGGPGNGGGGNLPPIISLPAGPNIPPPGSPPAIVAGTHPSNPIVPPAAVMFEFPGIGQTVVPQPTATIDRPTPPVSPPNPGDGGSGGPDR